MSDSTKFTLYSFVFSQWAGVAHMGLAEKQFPPEQYDLKEIDLVTAENFDSAYVDINPNGTVPSLTSPSLDRPIIQSAEILRWLDKTSGRSLVPTDPASQLQMQLLIDLVHSDDMRTDLILYQARSVEELEKKKSVWTEFFAARQAKLEQEKASRPDHVLYGPKSEENGALYRLYTSTPGPDHEAFFQLTHDMYRKLAQSIDHLEELLVLPYAIGTTVSEADLNMVPWFAHAMWGADTNPSEIHNFDPLEKLIQKTVPDFKVGPKTKKWWDNISQRESFKKVFSTLH